MTPIATEIVYCAEINKIRKARSVFIEIGYWAKCEEQVSTEILLMLKNSKNDTKM